jgi:hypothetical protein
MCPEQLSGYRETELQPDAPDRSMAHKDRGEVECWQDGGWSVDDKAMQLLKAMREQLGKTSAGRSVDAVVAASRLGMDRDTLDFHRSLHDLVRADYLEEPTNPTLRAQGKYLLTFEGIAAADNY